MLVKGKLPNDFPPLVALLSRIETGAVPVANLLEFLAKYGDVRAKNIRRAREQIEHMTGSLRPKTLVLKVAGRRILIPTEAFK